MPNRRPRIIEAADLFCGAGGSSSGLVEAARDLGLNLRLLAINHWQIAIDTHSTNHPDVEHLCETLDNVNPRNVVPGGRLHLLIASPECTHHSVARGGKPINDQSRASAWHVLRWCEALRVENVLIENVKEFQSWSPLGVNGRPMKSRKGETYRAFLNALRSLGYTVEDRIINAANHGDATTRERLFIIARKGRKQIKWPEPSHAKVAQKTLLGTKDRWRPAREIIDWDIPGQSIFTRKRPLAPNTLARILAGLKKFGGLEFVIPQTSTGKPRSVEQPIPTITTTSRGVGLCQPFLVVFRNHQDAKSLDDPLPSMTTSGANFGLCEPFIVPQHAGGRNRSVDEPLPTITGNGTGLVQPFLVRYNGNHNGRRDGDRRVQSVDDPISTLDTSNRLALCQPFLVHSGGPKGEPRSIEDPLRTLLAREHQALFTPFIIPFFGERDGQEPRVHSIDDPLPAVTGHGAGGLVEPFIVPVNHGNGDVRTHDIDNPMPTITTVDAWGLIEPFLLKYNSTGGPRSVDDPLDTISTKDRFALVQAFLDEHGIEADGIALLDIRFRMLQPHELAAAMSFPKTYIFTGNREQKVKQIGNAVAVRTSKALCMALLEDAA